MPIISELIGHRATAANLITGSGILRGVLVSHTQGATNEDVIFYDNTSAAGTVLLVLHLNQANMPYFLMLPRDDAIRFSTGLSLASANVEVNVWAVQLT